MSGHTECRNCKHPFHSRHVEDERVIPTDDEIRARKCRDCVDCHPPDGATVREDVREAVPA